MAIAYCRIFPSIGIARLGNSPEFFIGPEAPGIVPDNGGSYKDASKRVKRQAARFRIYAFDDSGQSLGELTADTDASIRWSVTLANTKASWFAFDGADNVATILREDPEPPAPFLRNADVPEADRHRLEIRPPAAAIEGRSQQVGPLEGTFAYPAPGLGDVPETKVVLGELRTDDAGRLLVIGGNGRSDTVIDDNPLRNYANNDAWFDDASDGPISAEVTLSDGTKPEVRGGAWVIVTPPHFSPYTENAVTAYDVVVEAALRHNLNWPENELGPKPDWADRVSFTRDVFPLLRRLDGFQWISQRAQRGHARGKNGYFLDPAVLKVLSDPAQAGPASLHRRVFERLRTPLNYPPFEEEPSRETSLNRKSQTAVNQANLTFMPPLAGDEGDVEMGAPTAWLSITEFQYAKLLQWQKGEFDGDWSGVPTPRPFEAIPIDEQPLALIRAALDACQGGAFFPGIEITSIVRFAEFWQEAFRPRLRSDGDPKFHGAEGDVTKWMACPWQADFYECRLHWWPTVRPDDVVTVSDYDRVLREFEEEQEQGVSSILIPRVAWDRGVVGDLPGRPGLPSPGTESPSEYRQRCARQLQRFLQSYVEFFRRALRPSAGESLVSYKRRVQEFLGRTILKAPDFVFPPDDAPPAFHQAVRNALNEYITVRTAPDTIPEPAGDETTASYARRLNEAVAPDRPVWQGLFDVEWRFRAENRGKDDMVKRWHRLGFVAPQDKAREGALVERDRGRFDLLSPRDSFYFMMNLEQFPDFTEKAKELAEEFLAQARELMEDFPSSPTDEHYARFTYDEVTFRARLEKIYETERRSGESYDPSDPAREPVFRTPAHVVERIRQLAPFNQLDGSWLEKVTKAGPIDDVSSFLFEIWGDEIGNGDPAQNHANVYSDLMHSAGIYLPPIYSRAYADHPDLWESSFIAPAYHASIAHFPQTYFPELLGMTLYLEWEAIFLPAMVKLYRHHGYNALFYTLHVAIDNPVIGHGARARDAAIRYLNDVRTRAGEDEMQQHWQRIWDGYIAFRYVGASEWLYRFTHPRTLDEQMIDMMERKRHYAQLNHNVRRLGVNSVNDWFDEPDAFLKELANSDLVVKGDAGRSKIFALFAQSGPMLKVFDAKDRELWGAWINSLPPDPIGAVDPATAMLRLVQQLSSRAIGVPEHGTNQLIGVFTDPETGGQREVTQPVMWWLQLGDPVVFMEALIRTENGWVVPGNSEQSRFVKELILGGGPMSRFFTMTIPEVQDKPARDIVIDWIKAGCPIPGPLALTRNRITAAGDQAPVDAAEAIVPRIPARRVEMQDPRVLVRTLTAVQRTADEQRGLQQRAYRWNGGSTH